MARHGPVTLRPDSEVATVTVPVALSARPTVTVPHPGARMRFAIPESAATEVVGVHIVCLSLSF